MDIPNGNKVHISLFWKIFLSFAALVTFLALTISIIFLQLYQNAAIDDVTETMKKNGAIVAEQCANILTVSSGADALTQWSQTWALCQQSMNMDIWPILPADADPTQTVSKIGMTLEREMFVDTSIVDETTYESISKTAKDVFKHGSGLIPAKREYLSAYGKYMITVGVPVIDTETGKTVLALVCTQTVEIQQEVVKNGRMLMVISVMISVVLASIVAFVFAKRLTKPIQSVQKTALELASGNYDIDLNPTPGGDEIGDLINSMGYLASALSETERQRKILDQQKLDFFANVSHELRTPITVMRAYTESMLDGVMSDEQKEQCYPKMLKECQGMQRLVNDLLLLSKMQNPDFIVDKEPINVVQIVDDIMRSAIAIAKEKSIDIKFTKSADIVMMMGDYDRIRQMLLVIVDNAIKFSNENSSIYIGIEADNGQITISIRDEGVGIAKDDLNNIFDKFYKSKLRQNATGSGLGLTIAKYICLKHDGQIEVESELGKGTEFRFHFTRIDDDSIYTSRSDMM